MSNNKFAGVSIPFWALTIGGLAAGYGILGFIDGIINPKVPSVIYRPTSDPYPTGKIDKRCFVQSMDLVPPDSEWIPDHKVIGVYVDNKGHLIRKSPNPALQSDLDMIDLKDDSAINTELIDGIAKITKRDVLPKAKYPDNMPLNPTRSGVSAELSTGDSARKDYTKISYVLLNEAWSFNPVQPYKMLNHPGGTMASPFINESRGFDDVGRLKVLTFTYYANTGQFLGSFEEYKDKKCKYAFNLYVDAKEKGTGHTASFELSTPIIIDPIIQNDGLP